MTPGGTAVVSRAQADVALDYQHGNGLRAAASPDSERYDVRSWVSDVQRDAAATHRLLAAMRRMSAILSTGSDLEPTLRELLSTVLQALDLSVGAILTLDESRRDFSVLAKARSVVEPAECWFAEDPDDGWLRFDLAADAVSHGARLAASSTSVISTQTHGDIGTIVAVPVVLRDAVLGVVELGSEFARLFVPSEIQLAESLAEQIALAIGNHNARRRIREQDERINLLLKSIDDAHEYERERICLDLHDGVAQTLAAVCQYQQLLENRPELQAPAVRPLLAKTGALLQRAVGEIRETISALRPAALDNDGLVSTIASDLDNLRTQHGWEVSLEADHMHLPESVETALYRIVSEAIGNARKHSRTTRLDVSLRRSNGRVTVEVRDYGIGFDPARLRPGVGGKRVGLLSMRRRAELLSGQCVIQSIPGRGTTIRVEVPLGG